MKYEIRSCGGRPIVSSNDYETLVLIAESNDVLRTHEYPVEIWENVRADRGEWEQRETIELIAGVEHAR